MRVLVYVEGPGDRASLERLLRDTLAQARQSRVGISFFPREGKEWLLRHLARTAASHLRDNPGDYVFALPDLFPMRQYEGTPEAHRSLADLKALLLRRFEEAAERHRLPAKVRSHFRAHGLQHDLEALLLGVPELLRKRLGTQDALEKHWRKPVESQNGQEPPKRVIEKLFNRYLKRRYNEVTDAPWILERASPEALCAACPQGFKPFFSELSRLTQGESLE